MDAVMPATTNVDRSWVTLLSHELGGPIAVLRGYSALWIEGGLGDASDGLGELSRQTWADANSLAAGLNDLLEDGRSMAGPPGTALATTVGRFESFARPVVRRLLSNLEGWLRSKGPAAQGVGLRSVQSCHAKTLMLSGLIDQLSLAVGLEAGAAKDWQIIDVRRWLRDLAHQVAGAITATGHRLLFEADATPAQAFVAPELLQAALLNLLDNAQKFSPAGAAIVVSATCVDESVVIRVSDRGPGLPEGLVPALFARVDHPAAFDFPGLGLGLAIAANVAQMSGGELRHARRRGGGSAFTLSIPRSR
jgi:signal transduction histidine kinase